MKSYVHKPTVFKAIGYWSGQHERVIKELRDLGYDAVWSPGYETNTEKYRDHVEIKIRDRANARLYPGHYIVFETTHLGDRMGDFVIYASEDFELIFDKMDEAEEPELTDFPVIGPECFTDRDGNVISWRGQEYVRTCGEFVKDLPEGGQAFCTLTYDHPGDLHVNTHV